jgi:hypothetical protein
MNELEGRFSPCTPRGRGGQIALIASLCMKHLVQSNQLLRIATRGTSFLRGFPPLELIAAVNRSVDIYITLSQGSNR